MEGNIGYNNGVIKGIVSIQNKGKDIWHLSSGEYPVNLGVSILDADGNVINQDFMRIPIKKKGIFANNEKVDVEILIEDMEEIEQSGYRLRFEMVQGNVTWIDKMAIYFKHD